MQKYILISFSLLLFNCSISKTVISTRNLVLNIQPTYGEVPLILDKTYHFNNSDEITIEVLQFYISNLALYQNEKLVWTEANSFHLIDYQDSTSLKLHFDWNENLVFNTLKFNLGIDSTTSVAGVMSADLDPTNGMYWTWQSGYINFKIEGKSNLCNTRNNRFQFHLGGYQSPFNALQTVTLNLNNEPENIILFDVKQFLTSINLATENSVMSPSQTAVTLSAQIANIFKIKP